MMKTLFLIDGAAGTGKSDLLQYVASRKAGSAVAVPKYTTRGPRDEELAHKLELDLHFPPDTYERFRARTREIGFYWYVYGNKETGEHHYGVYHHEIVEALTLCDLVFLIVRNTEVAAQIKRALPDVQCVSIFMYSDRDKIKQRLRTDGYTKDEIGRRMMRQPLPWNDYVVNAQFYDEVLVNNSDRRDFVVLIEALIAKWRVNPSDRLVISPSEQFRLIEPLVGFRERIQQRLARAPYRNNVFLMMKFRKQNELVHEFIAETLTAHNLNCIRADNPDWDITRNVYNPIAVLYGCKFGIALFDEPEPDNAFSANVAYELGMMHQQGKECLVLISDKVKEIPFDFVKELYARYSDNLQLRKIINDWVRKLSR
jgi:guanylate kinase